MFSFFFGYHHYLFNVLLVLSVLVALNIIIYYSNTTDSLRIQNSVNVVTLGVRNWINSYTMTLLVTETLMWNNT